MTKRERDLQRPRGPKHGKSIKAALALKKSESQLAHLESQSHRLSEELRKQSELAELVPLYVDLVNLVFSLVPADNNLTHGPTRRLARAQQNTLLKRAQVLGADLFQD